MAAAAVVARAAFAAANPPSLATRCGGMVHAQTFWFAATDGARLDGAILGSGRTGVVLATGYPSDLCGWAPEAAVLRSHGFRVLLFDFRGLGLSPLPRDPRTQLDYTADLIGATRALRARGASRIYLMGASLGATTSIVAATRIRPLVAGVVSLSGVADLSGVFPGSGLDAVAAAKRLQVPVLYLVAKGDFRIQPPDLARMRRALRSRGSRVIVFPGPYHGWDLLYYAPYRVRVEALVLGFLKRSRRARSRLQTRRRLRGRRPPRPP